MRIKLFAVICLGFIMQSCGGSVVTAAEKGEYYMDCSSITNSMNKKIQRCVNEEVTCYIYDDSSMSCTK